MGGHQPRHLARTLARAPRHTAGDEVGKGDHTADDLACLRSLRVLLRLLEQRTKTRVADGLAELGEGFAIGLHPCANRAIYLPKEGRCKVSRECAKPPLEASMPPPLRPPPFLLRTRAYRVAHDRIGDVEEQCHVVGEPVVEVEENMAPAVSRDGLALPEAAP